jgi:2,3-bisphosphoglycerate-dependent phosphoglycerate mutase
MKVAVFIFIGLLFFTLMSREAFAQNKKITIILLRHAEKDLLDAENTADPNLSAEGRARAQRLLKAIGDYKPLQIYVSEYKRTQQTAAPLAEKRKLAVKSYDTRKLKELAEEISSVRKSRRIVVVGHNTTTPALANLLLKTNQFRPLGENEYDKIWVIRLENGGATVMILKY